MLARPVVVEPWELGRRRWELTQEASILDIKHTTLLHCRRSSWLNTDNYPTDPTGERHKIADM